MSRLRFFFHQAITHLSRERQRTLFVLFCITAGVAAVVSLRTLGLMIGQALTGDLQRANHGDVALTMPSQVGHDSTDEIDASLFHVEGDLGGSQAISLSRAGEARLQAWIAEQDLEAMPFWTNGGPFARIYKQGTATAQSIMILCVDGPRYPYYGSVQILRPAGGSLAQALAAPQNLAISDELAQALEVGIGDTVELTGASQHFQVAAIVDAGSESSLADPFFAVFPFAYAAYETCTREFGQGPNAYFLKVPAGTDLPALKQEILARFRGLQPTTTHDLRQINHELSQAMTRLTTMVGLISLLIGGIGIANTMTVVVSRRTVEIAILKTIGVPGHQIAQVFIVEALLLGTAGSLLGIPLGLGLVVGLGAFAGRFVAQSLTFTLYPEALGMGLLLGITVTLVFGLLPILSAAKVRPNLVLRPAEAGLPRGGRLSSLLTLLALTAVMGLIVGQILGDLVNGLLAAYGTLLLLGLALLLLRGLVWLISRLPSLGSIALKIAQRAMGEHTGRVASTLLALVIGIFCLSLLWLLVRGTLDLVTDTAPTFLGGNVLATVRTLKDGRMLEKEIARRPEVGLQHDEVYVARVVAINGHDDIEALVQQARHAGWGADVVGDPNLAIDDFIAAFDMKVLDDNTWPYEIVAGEDIASGGLPDQILLEPGVMDNALAWFDLEPGDTLTLRFPSGARRTATIAGVTAPHNGGFLLQGLVELRATRGIVSPGFVPEGEEPHPSVYLLDVPDESLNETMDLLAGLPGVYMAATSEFVTYTERFAQRFVPLPLLLSGLALFAAGVIMANTVSLSTLERRRQIGIMKALGLQAESALGLLLLENGLVGLVGGLLGTGLSAIALSLSGALGQGRIPLGALGLLILLAVGLTLGATLLTAYGASREKPLNVLRYE